MKAVRVNSLEEVRQHAEAGHELEYTSKDHRDTIDMPPCYEPDSGGWVDMQEDDLHFSDSMDYRAWVPDDWQGFGYTFKVGDKGKTRGGRDYEILSVTGDYVHSGKYPQPIIAYLSGKGEGEFSPDGLFNPEDGECTLDLMPPDDASCVDGGASPEVPEDEVTRTAEHESEPSTLKQLAAIAAQYGIRVEYDIADDIVTFYP